ncbi:DUF402 domain-containing protein [Streptomyces narbonensis]
MGRRGGTGTSVSYWFEPGDVFVEHYWRDRWYTRSRRCGPPTAPSRAGRSADITRPAEIDGSGVVIEDLDLDLWVSADGSEVLRLDEDEFEASGLAASDPEAAAARRRGPGRARSSRP